jgi:hypothetical protein
MEKMREQRAKRTMEFHAQGDLQLLYRNGEELQPSRLMGFGRRNDTDTWDMLEKKASRKRKQQHKRTY